MGEMKAKQKQAEESDKRYNEANAAKTELEKRKAGLTAHAASTQWPASLPLR